MSSQAAAAANAGSDATAQAQAVSQQYHGTLVPPYCMAAAQSFFGRILTAASSS